MSSNELSESEQKLRAHEEVQRDFDTPLESNQDDETPMSGASQEKVREYQEGELRTLPEKLDGIQRDLGISDAVKKTILEREQHDVERVIHDEGEKHSPHVQMYTEIPVELHEKINAFNDQYEADEPDTRTPEQLSLDRDKHSSEPYAHLFYREDDGSIAGMLDLHTREVDVDDEKIMVGGIGGVVTLKEKRGRGIASELLRQAMDELRKSGHDIAFLNTDTTNPKLVTLYERSGFEIFQKPYTYLGRSGKRYTELGGMIASLQSPEKLEKIKKSTDDFNLGQGNW